MFCSRCGTENAESSKFCLKCGSALDIGLITDEPRRPFARGIRAPDDRRPKLLFRRKLTLLAIVGLTLGGFLLGLGLLTRVSPSGSLSDLGTVRGEPESYESFLTGESFQQLAFIAGEFTNPRSRSVITAEINIASLINRPSEYDGMTAEITGRVMKKTLLYKVAPYGWPESYLLIVDDESGYIPVLYRGYVGEVRKGDKVRVRGVFSQRGSGINADWVEKIDRLTAIKSDPVLLTLVYVFSMIGTLAFAVFSLGMFWRLRRRAKRLAGQG